MLKKSFVVAFLTAALFIVWSTASRAAMSKIDRQFHIAVDAR